MPEIEANPFLDIIVQPSYGARKVLVSWVVAQGYDDMKFYVFRSMNNGAPPWKAITDLPVPGTSFEDDAFFVDNRMQQTFYRLVGIMPDGREFKSAIISMYDQLTMDEYKAVHTMMDLEYQRMSKGNGLRMLHYQPLVEGELSDAYDPDTGQMLVATCPDDGNYGLRYKGGYGPPLQTWVELMKVGPELNVDRSDGKGADTTYNVMAKMLAFPKPMTNHLIIHPTTDNRYVVAEQVQPLLFKGLIPIAYDVPLKLLRRNDPRYMVPVPSMHNDPTWTQRQQQYK